MINPIKYEFVLLKTQEMGEEIAPMNIEVAIGSTYTDDTKNLTITRISEYRVLVTFRVGLSFELEWDTHWSNVLNVKVPTKYTAENQSRGIMGSTSGSFQKCEL